MLKSLNSVTQTPLFLKAALNSSSPFTTQLRLHQSIVQRPGEHHNFTHIFQHLYFFHRCCYKGKKALTLRSNHRALRCWQNRRSLNNHDLHIWTKQDYSTGISFFKENLEKRQICAKYILSILCCSFKPTFFFLYSFLIITGTIFISYTRNKNNWTKTLPLHCVAYQSQVLLKITHSKSTQDLSKSRVIG